MHDRLVLLPQAHQRQRGVAHSSQPGEEIPAPLHQRTGGRGGIDAGEFVDVGAGNETRGLAGADHQARGRLPVKRVVAPSPEEAGTPIGDEAYTGPGALVNSDFLDGMTVEDAKAAVIAELLGSDCRASDVLFSTRILKKTGLRLRRAGPDD